MSLLDGNKESDSKDNWRERDEKMENGALSPDNNNTLDKNRNGVLPASSPEPDSLNTLFNNGQCNTNCPMSIYIYQYLSICRIFFKTN